MSEPSSSRRSRRRRIGVTVLVTAVALLCWYAANPPPSADEKRLYGYWRVSSDGEATHDIQFHRNQTILIRLRGDATFGKHGAVWSARRGQLVARPFNRSILERLDFALQGLMNGKLQFGSWDERYGVQFVNDDTFELLDPSTPNIQLMFDRINESTPPLPEDYESDNDESDDQETNDGNSNNEEAR